MAGSNNAMEKFSVKAVDLEYSVGLYLIIGLIQVLLIIAMFLEIKQKKSKDKHIRYQVHSRQLLWKDWKARIKSDIFLEPKQEIKKVKSLGDWIFIRIVSTNQDGWIPKNTVVPLY